MKYKCELVILMQQDNATFIEYKKKLIFMSTKNNTSKECPNTTHIFEIRTFEVSLAAVGKMCNRPYWYMQYK